MTEKKNAAIKAADYIEDNMTVGLGTGSTAYYVIERVGELVKHGLNIKAVATSLSTSNIASGFNIPLVSIDEVERIDFAIDGVDEIDGGFNAIKGGGGALFREKMVATLADRVIWIMDSSKVVDAIGTFPLPVEILTYGYNHILRKLELLSLSPVLRLKSDGPFLTDNHNYIVDLHIGKGFDIKYVSEQLKAIPGVLETGLFLNMCDRIIVGIKDEVKVIENPGKLRQ
ncbi:ribose-5-phosphate isomerase RpiA [Ruminiclostridium cellobioparum]|uniref:Ribose-5-phosphate isomerase A n=1 Tax=Ruminiclostridium cellobioparum subsp. termitidis CT1112 TaxID=1195236 RepID=S0FF44_RUMCE|nr:ribose-5-phosphate isomerase RpiA [Ruminiclostridium cellobioparum]EMS69320.1 ribose 5-phosphate isomerase [Ruminiclostridium cellobioparum subsp. termitidis CT1112]